MDRKGEPPGQLAGFFGQTANGLNRRGTFQGYSQALTSPFSCVAIWLCAPRVATDEVAGVSAMERMAMEGGQVF